MSLFSAMAQFIRVESSAAFLSIEGHFRRKPRSPKRKRPGWFWDSYEDRALFYDCFWNTTGDRVMLIGPPALNLAGMVESSRFVAQPSGAALRAKFYPSRSTQIVELSGAASSDQTLTVAIGGEEHELIIQPNLSRVFAGRRMMVTMNRDNDLEWISGWARWHQRMHGVDAIAFFDNGSKNYDAHDLEITFGSIPGIELVAFFSWPFKYGRKDPSVITHPHYVHFLQVSSLNVTLRRVAQMSGGLLNCDVDELVGTAGRGSAFDQLATSPEGIIKLKGRWVEAIATETPDHDIVHLRYRVTHRNPLLSVCANKWIIDPSRDWFSALDAKPSVHRIYDIPKSIGRNAPTLPFWHFKAITTNWKTARSRPTTFRTLIHRRLETLDHEIVSLDGHVARSPSTQNPNNAAV